MGIGDEIMVSGRARVLQQTDPRKCRVTCRGLPHRWAPIWDGNPRIARPEEEGDFQDLPARDMANCRPYHTRKTQNRWSYNLNFRPDVGEIYLTEAEKRLGVYQGIVVIEPYIKAGASPNKQWGLCRWEQLAQRMRAAGLRPTHLGPPGTSRLLGADFIETNTFRDACAVLSGAQACVLPEGGLHHAAAALGIPGVVIFGGFTPVELTGYPMHRNLGASLGGACGFRIPCSHCAAAMAAITPEQVFNELEVILD